MLQLIGLLAISWILIWFFEKENIDVLGLMPTISRIKYGAILFTATALCAASAFGLRMYFAKETYVISPSLSVSGVSLEVWRQFRSVMTEELICRGALLYILMKRTGTEKAILISSVLFAVFHWGNAGVWGNAMQMMTVFAFTFAMGLLLAYAFTKTQSLLIPFAIHFGWNLTQNYIFPDDAAGNHLFTLAAPPPSVTVSYFVFFTMLLLPKVSALVIDFFILRRQG